MQASLARVGGAAYTSLGFSICQALIERAGGSLQVDPTSSLGFRIDMEYPLARSAWEKAPEAEENLRASPRGIRSGPVTALVVEPDETLQQVIVEQLADQNIRVVPVSNADEALAIAKRMQVDWVFCELKLPRLNGVEVYERVRGSVEQFVFIADEAACSANPQIFHAADKSVLRKPFEPADVEALIEEFRGGMVELQDV